MNNIQYIQPAGLPRPNNNWPYPPPTGPPVNSFKIRTTIVQSGLHFFAARQKFVSETPLLARSHLIMSVFAASPLLSITPHSVDPSYIIGAAAIGGLWPDIDEKGSTISRKAFILSAIASRLFEHRGGTHTIIAIGVYMAITLTMFLYSGNQSILWAGFAFIIGNIAHFAGDMMTLSGLTLLNPMSSKRLFLLPKQMRFRTGGITERALIIPVLSVTMGYVYIEHFKVALSMLNTH